MAMLPRTAVIVVHGIGEQEPLDTLLSFVGRGSDPAVARTAAPEPLREDMAPVAGIIDSGDGVVDATAGDRRFVLPDRLAGTSFGRIVSVDMRHRIRTVPGVDDAEARSWSRTTHFYEYYWAYRFRDTAWRHLPSFVRKLVEADRSGLEDGFMKAYGPSPDHAVSAGADRLARIAAIVLALATGVVTALVAAAAVQAGHPLLLGGGGLLAALFAVLAVTISQFAGVLTTIRTLLLAGLSAAVGYVVGAVFAAQTWPSILTGAAAGVLVVAAVAGAVAWRMRLAVTLSLVVLAVVLAIVATNLGDPERGEMWGALAGAQTFLGAVIPVVTLAVGGFALSGLGDAARYLSSKPDNISERESIRAGLVERLRQIAEDRDEVTQRYRYDRIVLVGHSLGTVIACDALHAYWNTVAPEVEIPLSRVPLADGDDADAVTRYERAVRRVERHALAGEVGGEAELDRAALSEALRAPHRLEGEEVVASGRWIVTDLVTLACPLTHAEILVTSGADAFAEAKQDRFLSTAPPQAQRTASAHDSHALRYKVWTGVRGEDTSRLHQSAQFASTTWTNMFFTHDLVGGELASRFGAGVRDVPVGARPATLGQFIAAYPHSSYWGAASRKNVAGRDRVLAEVKERCFAHDPVLVVFGEEPERDGLVAFVQELGELDLAPVSADNPAVEVRVLMPVATDISPGEPRQDWLWLGRPARVRREDVAQVAELARAHGLEMRKGVASVADDTDAEDASE
ncbi:hypothetical protein [Demequina sp. NBRC 110056]|uniref:hypothetical protein n=1 Tax=Demequina sp. NBRC 110056 TaxID=1570345 RepID=UPI0009FFC25C|nr:hypothetical protein [Demequina sp. NBRC 110056]